MKPLYGGVEAGGTKFVCATGTGPDDIRSRVQFRTTTPEETLGGVVEFFKQESVKEPLKGIGIGSFGPLDLNPASANYGYITATPKPGWSQVNILGVISAAVNLPVAIDTDVNAAALGEQKWGAARGLNDLVYLTVGTGIGGGGIISSRLLHGLVHPEMGHMRIPHDYGEDPFSGVCPFHGDCLEGLASGTALARRWGKAASELPAGHPAWELESSYLASGVANLICVLSPKRIILGGGVMQQSALFPQIRQKVKTLLNGYIHSPEVLDKIDEYIVPPGLGGSSGVLGALALAQRSDE